MLCWMFIESDHETVAFNVTPSLCLWYCKVMKIDSHSIRCSCGSWLKKKNEHIRGFDFLDSLGYFSLAHEKQCFPAAVESLAKWI